MVRLEELMQAKDKAFIDLAWFFFFIYYRGISIGDVLALAEQITTHGVFEGLRYLICRLKGKVSILELVNITRHYVAFWFPGLVRWRNNIPYLKRIAVKILREEVKKAKCVDNAFVDEFVELLRGISDDNA